MSTLLLLDSDIASYIIKARHPSVDARFAEVDASLIAISAVTQSELLFGLKRLDPGHQYQLSVRRFLRDTRILPWGTEAAVAHADIRHRLVSGGRAIGELDMMIAAHAVSLGAVLVTNNVRHFGRLAPTLTIENWVDDSSPS
jgi:tRNA(fMet)-specific endonuclease VapC